MKTKEPRTAADRQRDYRESGRALATVIKDPVAIDALDRLTAAHGTQRAAVESALIDAAKKLAPPRKRRAAAS